MTDNPARDAASKLTERSPAQTRDYHPERTRLASEAYRDGWDRIFGKGGDRSARMDASGNNPGLEPGHPAMSGAVEQSAAAPETVDVLVVPTKCHICGGQIGPDITGRPMCYGCGPGDMRPGSFASCVITGMEADHG